MARTGPGKPGFGYQLKAAVRREPKKTIALGVLITVLIVISGWELMRRSGPARATAAVVRPTADLADGTASPAGAPGTGTPQRDAGNTAADAAGSGGKLAVDRDLFTPDPTYFAPRRKSKPAAVKRVDDSIAIREAQEQAVRAQARALTLQSTIVGGVNVPTAIINGEVLRVGDAINGFRVVEIASRSCTVEKTNLRITLEMTN
jgi:hypothetical protein